MKINKTALMRAAGISCSFRHEGQDVPARLAFVTENTVLSSRSFEAENGPAKTQMRYGSILAYVGSEAGKSEEVMINPGQGGDKPFHLGGLEFLGRNMLEARDALLEASVSEDRFGPNESRLLSAIQETFGMIASAPDESRFPLDVIGQAYHAAMSEAFGPVHVGVSWSELGRKGQADLVRARLNTIDPDHPDGISKSSDLLRVLDRAGADVHQAHSAASGSAVKVSSQEARRVLISNTRLSEDVLGALTKADLDSLDVTVLSDHDLGVVRGNLSEGRLSGAWVDEVMRRVREITMSGVNGYHFEATLHTTEGRDLMTVSDNVSRMHDVGFVYSWPTAQRAPAVDCPAGRVVTVSPCEVPDAEEVSRLRRVLHQVENETEVTPDEVQAT